MLFDFKVMFLINCILSHSKFNINYIHISTKAKNVELIAVGYGINIKEDILKDIAGSNGHVELFDNIDELIKNIDAIVANACGKNKIESYYRPVLCSYNL